MKKIVRKLSPVESHKVITKLIEDYGETKMLDKNAEKIGRAYSQELGFPVKGCSIRYLADELKFERRKVNTKAPCSDDLMARVEGVEKRLDLVEAEIGVYISSNVGPLLLPSLIARSNELMARIREAEKNGIMEGIADHIREKLVVDKSIKRIQQQGGAV